MTSTSCLKATISRGDDMLKRLIAKLRAARHFFAWQDFKRGYDEAAGALLRDEVTTLMLTRTIDRRGVHEANGVLAAIDDFNGLREVR